MQRYFGWVHKVQNVLLSWRDKFLQLKINYDEVLRYASTQAWLNNLGLTVCATSAVLDSTDIQRVKNQILQNYKRLNLLLIRYIQGQSDAGWCTLPQLLDDYGVALPPSLLDPISRFLQLPGETKSFPDALVNPLPSNTSGTFQPGQEVFVRLSKHLQLCDLAQLVQDLETFLEPILDHQEMMVFFKLHHSEIFEKHIQLQLKKDGALLSSVLPVPTLALEAEVVDGIVPIHTLLRALTQTKELMRQLMQGKPSAFFEVIAEGELGLELVDIDREFEVLTASSVYLNLPQSDQTGFSSVRGMLELSTLVTTQRKLKGDSEKEASHGLTSSPDQMLRLQRENTVLKEKRQQLEEETHLLKRNLLRQREELLTHEKESLRLEENLLHQQKEVLKQGNVRKNLEDKLSQQEQREQELKQAMQEQRKNATRARSTEQELQRKIQQQKEQATEIEQALQQQLQEARDQAAQAMQRQQELGQQLVRQEQEHQLEILRQRENTKQMERELQQQVQQERENGECKERELQHTMRQQQQQAQHRLEELQHETQQERNRAKQTGRDLQREVHQREEAERQLKELAQQAARKEQELREEIEQQRDRAERQQREQAEQAARREQELQREIDKLEFWKIPRQEVQISEPIGVGGWGTIARGTFRGQEVAVKRPHTLILNARNIRRLRREVRIMARIRHPNLLLFIAAVFDEQVDRLEAPPLIVTELLDMDLRNAYENHRLENSRRCKLTILHDVACALNYLHQHQEPIIHRDVSAPNVLLQAIVDNSWRAKLSDFGSANWAERAHTAGEGAIIYTAPEAFPPASDDPNNVIPSQTPKIDVYSYGVLLCEVITKRLPVPEEFPQMLQQVQREWPSMNDLVVSCRKRNPDDRPTMVTVLSTLGSMQQQS